MDLLGYMGTEDTGDFVHTQEFYILLALACAP